MKRLVATRKLKRTCVLCGCHFNKGEVYYVERKVFKELIGWNEEIIACEAVFCPRCKYREDEHKTRFERFKPKCHHPFVDDVWTYIPGEAVMEPHHSECRICGKWILAVMGL